MHKWVVAFYGTLCGFRLRSTCGTIWKRFIWLYEILERKIRHMKYNMYHKIPSYGNFIKRHLKTETIQFVYEQRIVHVWEKNLEIFFPPPFFSFFSFYILKAIRFHISVQRPSFKWVLVSFCLFSRTSIIVGRFFYTVLNTIHNSYDDFYGLNFIMNIIQNSGVEKNVGFFFLHSFICGLFCVVFQWNPLCNNFISKVY